jgi:hypothetical protein
MPPLQLSRRCRRRDDYEDYDDLLPLPLLLLLLLLLVLLLLLSPQPLLPLLLTLRLSCHRYVSSLPSPSPLSSFCFLILC